jgi:uncharacterized pyridoxamine 5'-phosphate oxidase family protein
MNRVEALEFARANPVCHMATVEDGEPRVRGMMTLKVDEKGLLFVTGTPKPLWSQLQRNPMVELCYYSRESGTQLRIRGSAALLDDDDLRREALERLPFLKDAVKVIGLDLLGIFRLESGQSSTWKMAQASEPPIVEAF